MIRFILNDQLIETQEPAGSTVLDFIRYKCHLMGTKIGCREGDCGACTILVGTFKKGNMQFQSMTSCIMPLGNAHGKHIVTVEGLNMPELSPIQQAIVDEGGTQCGFCTVGFVLSLTGFALNNKEFNYTNAIAAIDGNICRCTGYKSLERAAARIVGILKEENSSPTIPSLVEQHFLPSYFLQIPLRLEELNKNGKDLLPINGQLTVVGGGTDLLVQRPEEILELPIQLIMKDPSLQSIYTEAGNCYIGAAATAEDIQSSALIKKILPEIRGYMKLISSTPIRNMGTLGGNLVNASPIGDLTILFLALDSQLILNEYGKLRQLPLRSFYQGGYKQLDLKPGEHVERLFFQIPKGNFYFNFEKVSKRTHLDIASVNSACFLLLEDGIIKMAHLSAGGIAPIPKYLEQTSQELIGKKINELTISAMAEEIQKEVAPISDARGSASYKRLLLRQLFYAHFLRFFPKQIELKTLVSLTNSHK